MAFEEFTKKTAQTAGTAYVTIQKRGMFALNHAAYAALGEPKAVTLLFDRDRQLVGFRPADPASEHAYVVRPNSTGSGHIVTGTLFTRYHDIPTDVGRRLEAQMVEDDILAIDVTDILPRDSSPPVANPKNAQKPRTHSPGPFRREKA